MKHDDPLACNSLLAPAGSVINALFMGGVTSFLSLCCRNVFKSDCDGVNESEYSQ